MKLNKIVLPIAIALIATLAVTGCGSKRPVKTTSLPDHQAYSGSEIPVLPPTLPPSLPPAQPLSPGDSATGIDRNAPGGGPLPDWDPSQFNQDRAKLAAYTVHFKFDSAVVEDNEKASLTSVNQALAGDATAKLLIEGHCDERGTEEYNRALGERRALALREALVKDGADPMRIRTISYGKDKPADNDHNEAAWSKNRRGEFIWCTPKTSVQ